MFITKKDRFINAAAMWTKEKNFDNFLRLWRYGFETKNPFFKIWRVFRNTVNGRYREIAEKGYDAW